MRFSTVDPVSPASALLRIDGVVELPTEVSGELEAMRRQHADEETQLRETVVAQRAKLEELHVGHAVIVKASPW